MPKHKYLRGGQLWREHLSGYQRRDYEVVDYQMYELEGTRLNFRGPAPDFSEPYFTCMGAAQTLGCFCKDPFPSLLSASLNLPVLNLGYGGAGPEFFERHESLDRYINGGEFLVLQVMSGRSQSNSQFEGRGLEFLTRRSDGMALSSDDAYVDLLHGVPELRNSLLGSATPRVRNILRRVLPKLVVPALCASPKVRRVVTETRKAWVDNYQRLLSRITVPVILFWFSKRQPSYVERMNNVSSLFGEFPQLVNSSMVEQIAPSCEHYVECVSERGSPQLLKSRFTGQPVVVDTSLDRPDFTQKWTHNAYYPSPEMHQDAAASLHPICANLLEQRRVAR